jgi:hypothetical protein
VLRQVEKAEAAVRALVPRLRARHLGEAARVEIAAGRWVVSREPGVRTAVVESVAAAGTRASRSIPWAIDGAA